MKYIILFFLFFITNHILAQDVSRLKYIDSIVINYMSKASINEFEILTGTLLREGNKTSSIKFLKQSQDVRMIIVQDEFKENVDLYFFLNGNPIYTFSSKKGELNTSDYSVYFIDDTTYIKRKDVMKKVNGALWLVPISAYLDQFEDLLKR